MRIIMPDEDGHPKMVPAFDPMLEAFVVKHEHGLPDRAVTHGQQIEVMAVDQNTWDTMDVVTKIKDELHRAHGEVYDESTEYKDAAIRCYNEHGNPSLEDGCPDYMDDSKLIGNATYKDDDGNTDHHPAPVPPVSLLPLPVPARLRAGRDSAQEGHVQGGHDTAAGADGQGGQPSAGSDGTCERRHRSRAATRTPRRRR